MTDSVLRTVRIQFISALWEAAIRDPAEAIHVGGLDPDDVAWLAQRTEQEVLSSYLAADTVMALVPNRPKPRLGAACPPETLRVNRSTNLRDQRASYILLLWQTARENQSYAVIDGGISASDAAALASASLPDATKTYLSGETIIRAEPALRLRSGEDPVEKQRRVLMKVAGAQAPGGRAA